MNLKNTGSFIAAALSMSIFAVMATEALASPAPSSPPTPVEENDSSRFDGTYVGVLHSMGACSDPLREMVLIVKRSRASMVWAYRSGGQLVGDVSPDGLVKLHSEGFSYLVHATGRIDGDNVSLTSESTSSNGDCAYSMTFQRRDLSSKH